jgi:hypothetical protein
MAFPSSGLSVRRRLTQRVSAEAYSIRRPAACAMRVHLAESERMCAQFMLQAIRIMALQFKINLRREQ